MQRALFILLLAGLGPCAAIPSPAAFPATAVIEADLGDPPSRDVVSYWFLLPENAEPSGLRLTSVRWDTLSDFSDGPSREPATSAALDAPLTVTKVADLRRFRLARVAFRPLRGFSPTLIARGVRIAFDVAASQEPPSFRIERPEAFAPSSPEVLWILRHAANPGDLAEFYGPAPFSADKTAPERTPYGGFLPTAWPSLEGPRVDQAIITDDRSSSGASAGGMTAAFEEYASWKTDRGVPTVVARVQDIEGRYGGFDRVEKIKSYIREAVRDWGVRWVLLGGDLEIVPTRRLGGEDLSSHSRPDPPADVYYVRFGEDWNLDDDPYFWDETDGDIGPLAEGFDQAWIGRLPCRDAAEARAMLDKIRTYSENPPGGDYARSSLLATGPLNDMDFRNENSGYLHGEIVRDVLLKAGWPDPTRLYADVGSFSEICGGRPIPCYEELASYLDSLSVTPWEGTGLRDRLDEGVHFVWHLEHSVRQFLGNPTVEGPPPYPEECESPAAWASRCERALRDRWGSTRDLSKHEVLELANAPRYAVVFSGGSFTNEYDLDSVSKAFLRAPAGGAVAYIGKSLSFGGYGTEIAKGLLENVLLGGPSNIGAAMALAREEGFPEPLEALRKGFEYALLGDPEMRIWSRPPRGLEAQIVPSVFTALGPQDIAVLVRDEETGGLVSGATVCLRQGSEAYAVRSTDGDGLVRLDGFPVLNRDAVRVTVTAPDALPFRRDLDVLPDEPRYVYARHEIIDEDGGGVPNAGGTFHLRVVAENAGGVPGPVPALSLRVSAPVRFDLRIDGEADARAVSIGGAGAHPPASPFVLPPAGEGYRPEGEPPPAAGAPAFRVWRDGKDGLYRVEASAAGGAAVFTGVIDARGGLDDVAVEIEPDEDLVSWKGDSLRFRFEGDGSPDVITFRAEARDWIGLDPPAVATAAGDSLAASWSAALSPQAPDGFTMPFTLRAGAKDSDASFSDFSVSWAAPEPQLLFVEEEIDAGGTRLRLNPSIRNGGGGRWNELRLTLEPLAGDVRVEDGVGTVPDLEPGASVAMEDAFAVTAPSEEALRLFRYELRFEAAMDGGVLAGSFKPCEGPAAEIPAPENLRVDSDAGGYLLGWDPVLGADRYAVARLTDGGTPHFLGDADSTSRFLAPLAERGIRFSVRACAGCRCGAPAVSGPDAPWIPLEEGWPKRVPGGVTTAPKVLPAPFLGDRAAVFVAGRAIYAWFGDGSPLRSGDGYAGGLFYDPGLPSGQNRVFSEALALFQFEYRAHPLDPVELSWGLAGNVPGIGLIVLRLAPEEDGRHWRPELYWSDPATSSFAAPMAWPLREWIDPYGPVILLPTNDDLVRAWTFDGEPYLQNFPDGSFARDPEGSLSNFRSLAVAEAEDPGMYNVIQATRGGFLICWETPADRDRTQLARALWSVRLERRDAAVADFSLSSPAVGDVDGDGLEEVVVTNQTGPGENPGRPGRIWVVDPLTGDVESFGQSWDWSFRSGNDDQPPPRPSLADLDGDPSYEIVVAGRVDRPFQYVAEHRVHVFDVDGGALVETTCRDAPPRPSLNSGNIGSSAIDRPPVLFDVDGDGIVEILAPSGGGALFSFAPAGGGGCTAEEGWPMLFGDVVASPAVEDLDGDGDWEMVVTSQDGTVHVFDLAGGVGESSMSAWSQYAADFWNSSRVSVHRSMRTIPSDGGPAGGFLSLAPLPFRPGQSIRFSVAAPSPSPSASPPRVALAVYDVMGRRIRTLLDEDLPDGVHEIRWDGRDGEGREASSGIYFYRLGIGGVHEVRRTLLLR